MSREARHRRQDPWIGDAPRHELALHHLLAPQGELVRRARVAGPVHRFSVTGDPSARTGTARSQLLSAGITRSCVRSRCSGVTETQPALTAAWSLRASSLHVGGPPPI